MQSPAINQAMDILKLLRQVTEGQDEAPVKLAKIIKIIAEKMNADAAACYVAVDDSYLELFASYGFNADVAHKVTIRYGEGLVGEIARTSRSLAVADAWGHPKFSYKPELGEENYKSFLGVPLVRWSRSIGVLSLQNREIHEYSRLEIEILETVAMVLSEMIVSEEMTEYKKSLIKARGLASRERVKGLSLSKGYGIGKAVVHRRRQTVSKIFAEDREKELRRLETAYKQMNDDLDRKFASTQLGIGEHVDILDAYRMFAKDKGWYKKIEDNVKSGLTAEAAVERSYEDMWNRLSGTNDQYLKERLHDLRDVADRMQSYLSGDFKDIGEIRNWSDIVVVAQTMGPADLMDYDYHKIRGLIIEDGTPTMHVAIVAKALNIPVIAKIKGLFEEVKTGELIAVDGNDSYVYINPQPAVQEKFKAKIAEKEKLLARLAELRKLPSKTQDGVRIGHYINVGLSFDLDYIESTNCDGIGLYRTEIPFMASDVMPNVERQLGYYKELMDRAGNRKVIFRSLDVGSDKLLPYWSNMGEENPAIGWRSIRISLDRRAILRKQVRAFLRAAAGKELNVMFPMISDLSEFEEAKETLMIELEKERRKELPVPSKVNVGLMIEVPAIVFQLEDVLKQADFISIGTNDLTQYTLACDRQNNDLGRFYDPHHPAVLRLIRLVTENAHKNGIWVGICGELGADLTLTETFLAFGVDELSVTPRSVLPLRNAVRMTDTRESSERILSDLDSDYTAR